MHGNLHSASIRSIELSSRVLRGRSAVHVRSLIVHRTAMTRTVRPSLSARIEAGSLGRASRRPPLCVLRAAGSSALDVREARPSGTVGAARWRRLLWLLRRLLRHVFFNLARHPAVRKMLFTSIRKDLLPRVYNAQ
ncbi:hypothetical protein NDU88_004753 [Pleurodeles waltl]|uniref:Uncharacterized protein n=1 Tax=Pleurodeles waltl TaxID=8319 RepID=A0AAV7RI95_PLEWA|nr:hypothetical protein NDU88_004753 [Pleurodeles waltl]